MTQTFTRSLSATAAISAVLALGSTPVLAQEAAPTIQVPPVATAPAMTGTTAASPTTAVTPPAAAPAPTIVLPDVSAATSSTQTARAVEAESTSARSATVRPSAPSTARATAQRAPAPAAIARTAVADAPARDAASTPTTPAEKPKASSANILNDTPTRSATAQIGTPPTAPARPADDGIPGEALAGLLAFLGIGAVGYAAMRSRRRSTDADESTLDAAVYAEPIHDEEVAPRTAPVFGTPQRAKQTADWHYGFAPARADGTDTQVIEREPMAMAPPLAPTPERTRPGSATASPLPETADERTAMLDRMVDAEPDEANPFTSRKSRRKRARLLLQQREAEAQRSAPFDWRSYSPSTKPSSPAQPPLVTA